MRDERAYLLNLVNWVWKRQEAFHYSFDASLVVSQSPESGVERERANEVVRDCERGEMNRIEIQLRLQLPKSILSLHSPLRLSLKYSTSSTSKLYTTNPPLKSIPTRFPCPHSLPTSHRHPLSPLPMASKFSLASSLLLQSPPGELNDVFTDLRSLISSDQELESQILPALKQYNLEQFTVVEFPEGRKKKGVVCRDARGESEGEEGEEEKFVDWREGKAFGFNHMTAVSHSLSCKQVGVRANSEVSESRLRVSLRRLRKRICLIKRRWTKLNS